MRICTSNHHLTNSILQLYLGLAASLQHCLRLRVECVTYRPHPQLTFAHVHMYVFAKYSEHVQWLYQIEIAAPSHMCVCVRVCGVIRKLILHGCACVQSQDNSACDACSGV